MNIFSRIFGSESAIKSGFNLIDEAFHTSQEKAEDAERRTQQKIGLLKAFEGFKIAQRLLALIYSIPYMLAWLVTFGMSFYRDVSQQMEMLSGDVGMINLIVLGFYFGGGMAEGTLHKYALTKKTK